MPVGRSGGRVVSSSVGGKGDGRADGRPHGLGHDQTGQIGHPTVQWESRRNVRNKHRQMCCARGCKEALLRLAKFGTEATHAQLVEGTSDFFAVESEA